jgi:hypothetical protein
MVLWAPLQHGNFIDVLSALLMKTLNEIMLNVGFLTQNMVFPVFLVFLENIHCYPANEFLSTDCL